jgi:hypothetical protein
MEVCPRCGYKEPKYYLTITSITGLITNRTYDTDKEVLLSIIDYMYDKFDDKYYIKKVISDVSKYNEYDNEDDNKIKIKIDYTIR